MKEIEVFTNERNSCVCKDHSLRELTFKKDINIAIYTFVSHKELPMYVFDIFLSEVACLPKNNYRQRALRKKKCINNEAAVTGFV